MMDSKTRFVRFISGDYSIDYWSDIASLEAIQLAEAMSPTEWVDLCSNWEGLATICQVRLAEVAGDVPTENAVLPQMLVAMLSSGNPDVVEASLDSLHSISQLSPERLEPLDVGEAVANIVPGNKVVAVILESLKRRVGKPT